MVTENDSNVDEPNSLDSIDNDKHKSNERINIIVKLIYCLLIYCLLDNIQIICFQNSHLLNVALKAPMILMHQ